MRNQTRWKQGRGKNIRQSTPEDFSGERQSLEWRLLLAEYNLAEAEKTKNEYEKLLSEPGEDIEGLFQKQQDMMVKIFELEQKWKDEAIKSIKTITKKENEKRKQIKRELEKRKQIKRELEKRK